MEARIRSAAIATVLLLVACAAPSHSGDVVAWSSTAVQDVEYGRVERVDAYAPQNDTPLPTRYRVVVRLDSDVLMTLDDRRTTDLRAGDRVRVENGRVRRA
jgi:hypothetical protein